MKKSQSQATLDALESKRSKFNTVFSPENLSEYKIVQVLVEKGTTPNKIVDFALFDTVTFFKNCGKSIQAIGKTGDKLTMLVLSK